MSDEGKKNEEIEPEFEDTQENLEGGSESGRKAGTDNRPKNDQSSNDGLEVGKGDVAGGSGLGRQNLVTPGSSQDSGSGGSVPLATSTAIRGGSGQFQGLQGSQGLSDIDKQAFLEWMNSEGLETFLKARSPSPSAPRARGSIPDRGNVGQATIQGNELSSPNLRNDRSDRDGYFTPQNRSARTILDRRAETDGKNRSKHINRRLDELLSDTREQVSEDQDLEIRLSGLLDLDLRGVIVNLQGDHGIHTTRSRLRSLLRHGIRMIELGKRVTPGELTQVRGRIQDFMETLDGYNEGQGPSCRNWNAVYQVLVTIDGVLKEISDNIRKVAEVSDHRQVDASVMKGIIKAIEPLQAAQDIDEYLDHFEYLTDCMDLPARKRLLETKIGPKYLNRVKGARNEQTWNAFRAKLTEEMSEIKDDIAATMELSTLVQGEKTVQAYSDRTVALLAKMNIDPVSCLEHSTIINYINGLNTVGLRKKLYTDLKSERLKPLDKTLAFFMKKARESDSIERLATRGSRRFEDEAAEACPAAPVDQKPSTLVGNNKCDRHDKPTHTNAACRTPRGQCPYCKEDVQEWKFKDGSHERDCKAQRCHHCKVRGHSVQNCHRKNENAGGKREKPGKEGKDKKQKVGFNKGKKGVMAAVEEKDKSEEESE